MSSSSSQSSVDSNKYGKWESDSRSQCNCGSQHYYSAAIEWIEVDVIYRPVKRLTNITRVALLMLVSLAPPVLPIFPLLVPELMSEQGLCLSTKSKLKQTLS